MPQEIRPSPSNFASNPFNNNKSRNKIKRIACIQCRQQKSRCDAHENAPNPCTRCKNRGLTCELKADYKRTYKRAKNAQLEKAYNELRDRLNGLLRPLQSGEEENPLLSTDLIQKLNSVINTANAIKEEEEAKNGQDSKLNDYDNSKYININPIAGGIPAQNNNLLPNLLSDNHTPPAKLTESILICEPKTLQHITLSPNHIKELYIEFASNYHPIFPVIDINKGPERLYRLCPVLFWVIMLTSLRRITDNASRSLLMDLSPMVKQLLKDLTISPITRYSPSEFDEPVYNASSVYSVQAFLITTMWPPLASSLSADSSWNTIGIALFQAVRIGLHSPGHAMDFSNAAKTDDTRQLMLLTEQFRTWICCNIVSQTISTVFGYPAFTSFDRKLISFIEQNNELNIPLEIKQLMEATEYESQIVDTLSGDAGHFTSIERAPLIKILTQRLDKMELRFNFKEMDNYRKMAFLNSRIHLYTYFFFDLLEDDYSIHELPGNTKNGLIKLYDACIKLINHCQSSQTSDKRFMKYLPGVYVISIWQAAFIITKISFSPLKEIIDFQKGKNMYQVAIYLTLRNSVMKYDMAHRFSGIMQSLWQLFDTLYLKDSLKFNLGIGTRMAANVFFDCLLVLRQKSGMMKYMIKHDEEEEDVNSDVEGVDNVDKNNVITSKQTGEDNGILINKTAYVDNDYPDSDDSASLDEKIKDIGSTPSDAATILNDSNNSGLPHENQSNGSKKSLHTLEEIVLRPENSARKIIKTIPLDPIPIHKIPMADMNSSSSTSSPADNKIMSPPPNDDKKRKMESLAKQSKKKKFVSKVPKKIANTSSPMLPPVAQFSKPSVPQSFAPQPEVLNYNIPARIPPMGTPTNTSPNVITSLNTAPGNDLEDFWNSDLSMLLKDVSSVMNDFGFHDVYNEQPTSLFQFNHNQNNNQNTNQNNNQNNNLR